jgi:hypothetical protein
MTEPTSSLRATDLQSAFLRVCWRWDALALLAKMPFQQALLALLLWHSWRCFGDMCIQFVYSSGGLAQQQACRAGMHAVSPRCGSGAG